MTDTILIVIAAELGAGIIILLAYLGTFKKIQEERNKILSTSAADAKTALDKLVLDLSGAVKEAAQALKDILAKISQNAGVDPVAVVNDVQAAETLVQTLHQAALDAEASINPQPGVVVSISPSAATVAPGLTQQFSATVTGAPDTSVVWSAQQGSIDQNGLYTAPATSPGSDVVTATSNADNTKFNTASIAIQ